MNKTTLGIISTFITATLAIGCQTAPKASNTNINSSNTNAVNKPANAIAAPVAANTEPASSAPVGSLKTPTDTYKTAHDLRKRKDIEGVKKVMAPDALEFLTAMGEPEKSLNDMLREMCEKPQADKAEVRNEKISGDRATVEYLDEKGSWKVMDFQKIGGEWKIGFPKMDKNDLKVTNKED
jgi:hypothetical protein